ncbi:Ketosteroid isomerase homolog [Amycolatopsis arida]|uniref:Ketosteroid isomerase homolog n=1 Tax=Amycolatopsis arida TaxID=587909 RepID=A0A1I6AJE1_9PSEU|nr:nuclear transport factor 2 family protein [Amycolatopsis arida]TDX87320.1 ketosteroid isomerase-like protein [Amycolatopsis arida]SFQ68799.1 Ketosteroid isomerase homolog [Amycolatopsis arida]
MTTVHDSLAEHIARFTAAFNTGDAAALDQLYDEAGVLVPFPGHLVTGPRRASAYEPLLALGLPMRAELRHAYVAGEVALIVVDWSIRGTARDGTAHDMAGTAADVVRRTPDGQWRYLVDNPFGTAAPPTP